MSVLVPQGLSLPWLKTGRGRIHHSSSCCSEKKNKSMNSSPASGMYHKQERLVIKDCPLLKLEQKPHIAGNK